MGQKAYATKPEELPSNLAAYKHANLEVKWQGTDNGAYEEWILDRSFSQLKVQEAQLRKGQMKLFRLATQMVLSSSESHAHLNLS